MARELYKSMDWSIDPFNTPFKFSIRIKFNVPTKSTFKSVLLGEFGKRAKKKKIMNILIVF